MRECPTCGGCFEDGVRLCPADGQPTESTIEGDLFVDGKYRLERCMGRGGMGAVYQVRHRSLNRLFVLKLILPHKVTDPEFLRFFLSEAQLLGRLRHPHIVEVTDYGVDPRGHGLPYLVMVYLEGGSLGQLLLERGSLPMAEALPLLDSIAEAVDFAHANGVLHLDLKPANVLLAREGNEQRVVKILDFGLARVLDAHESSMSLSPVGEPSGSSKATYETQVLKPQLGTPRENQATNAKEMPTVAVAHIVSSIMGTPGYMAPEMFHGVRASSALDEYAFGIIAYEVLVGRKPFQGTGPEALQHQIHESPCRPTELNPSIPEDLNAPLLAPLDRDPALRPRTLKAVVAGIREAAERHRIKTWELRERPRRRGLAAAVGALVFGTIGIFHGVGPLRNLDHRQADFSYGWMPTKAPDPRIILVTLGESTLDDGSEYFFQRAESLTQRLGAILDAGAASVAVDMLLPRRFSESQSLSKLVLAHQDRIVLALYPQENGSPLGWECLPDMTRMALGSQEQLERLFGLVNLPTDGDGRIRSFKPSIPLKEGRPLETLSLRVLRRVAPGIEARFPDTMRIDLSVDPQAYSLCDWAKVPEKLKVDPGFFQGKSVFVGVDSASKEDVHSIPVIRGRAAEVSGLRIHALMLQTLLESQSIRDLPYWARWVQATLAGMMALIAAGLLLWKRRIWHGLAVAGAYMAGFLIFAFGLWFAGIFVAISTTILGLALALAASLLLRRFLSPIPELARPELTKME